MVKLSRKKRLPAGWEETPWIVSDLLPHGMMSIDPATREEMESFRNDGGHGCDFVPSGIRTPSYKAMCKDALQYYLFWRGSVRKGRFPKTDIGYIRLLFSEIVTLNVDPKNDIELMARILREYEDINIFQIGSLGDACVCHSRLNDVPLPRIPLLRTRENIAYQTYSALRSEPIGYLSVRNLMTLFDIDTELPKDVPLDALYRHIVSEADAMTRRLCGNRISDGIGTIRRSIPVYNGLVYHGNRKNYSLNIPTDLTDTPAGDMLSSILRMMLIGLGCEDIGSPYDGNEDIAYTVTVDVLERYREGELELEDPDAAFELDPDAIRESEEDLRAVTEMMRVDETPSKEEVKKISKTVSLTGWDGLRESLSDDMVAYLRAASDGDAQSFVGSRNMRMSAMEKGINTISMDMVDDVIVEDGTIIDDYIDEVMELLGCRGYRREHS